MSVDDVLGPFRAVETGTAQQRTAAKWVRDYDTKQKPHWSEVLREALHLKIASQSEKFSCRGNRLEEAREGAAWSFLSYAFPWLLTYLANNLHLSNAQLSRYARDVMAAEGLVCAQRMRDLVLKGEGTFIALPDNSTLGGFYLRTPVRIWRERQRVFKVPPWEKRSDLMRAQVIGGANIYVWRHSVNDCVYDLVVGFRGTCNEWNGIPQYGKLLSRTQVFHMPDFCPESHTIHAKGSSTIPLLYKHYWSAVMDVLKDILELLNALGAEGARRILVCGHSMGAALALTFGWLIRGLPISGKCHYRIYAAPL